MAATLVRHGSRSAGDTQSRLPRGSARCVIAKLPPIGGHVVSTLRLEQPQQRGIMDVKQNSVRINDIGLLKGFDRQNETRRLHRRRREVPTIA